MADSVRQIPAPPMIEKVVGAYSVRVIGDSMSPRYESGEAVYVDPFEPIRRNDYVVVQLYDAFGSGTVYGLVKRFVSQDDKLIRLYQFNPAGELTYPTNRVKSVHRIVLAG